MSESNAASTASSPPSAENTSASSSSSSSSSSSTEVSLDGTLKELFPSDDPLESNNFDPIAFINTTFPDEQSLVGGKLDTYLVGLRRKVVALQDSISRDVRQHSQSRSQTSNAIQSATNSITDLFKRIELIKEKASQSETMVQEICRDIRSLDQAKKHLTNTIRALRNLHMLVSAVGQLDMMVAEKQYRFAAERLRAITDLFTLFESYGDVPKIRSLRASVDQTKANMKQQLTNEFHRVLPSPLVSQEPQCTLMADACLVVDVLDSSFKNELLSWFCGLQLDEYIALFSFGKEGSSIDQIERRYQWMKNWLRNIYEVRYSKVFPTHWMVGGLLCKEFCKITRQHINKLYSSSQGKFDVQLMINTLLMTIEFEKMLNAKYRSHIKLNNTSIDGDDDQYTLEQKVEMIKQKHSKKTATEKKEEEERIKQDEKSMRDAGVTKESMRELLPDFIGSISDVFTPYMSGYIEMEKKNMSDLISQFEREENWMHPEEPRKSTNTQTGGSSAHDRFNSANDLFQYIKGSITRCSKLNKNITLFNLYQEYKKALSNYAEMLDRQLPRKQEGVALTQNEIILVCFIINTSEYVNDTIPGLNSKIQEIIDPSHREQIDFSNVSEEYQVLINKSVQILVSSMWIKLNKILLSMTKMPWSTWTQVGDESGYVQQIAIVLKEEVPVVSSKISAKYHPFYCNQIVQTFIPRYLDSIYRCKRIGELGAQQMSLDAHSLKQILLMVPNLYTSDLHGSSLSAVQAEERLRNRPVNKSYIKFVNTEMSKAEALLKTLVSPNERLIITFKALLPKSNIEDLMRILTLRGLKPSEQQSLVNAYNVTVPPEEQLKLKTERAGNADFSSILAKLRNN